MKEVILNQYIFHVTSSSYTPKKGTKCLFFIKTNFHEGFIFFSLYTAFKYSYILSKYTLNILKTVKVQLADLFFIQMDEHIVKQLFVNSNIFCINCKLKLKWHTLRFSVRFLNGWTKRTKELRRHHPSARE